jgi:hypothetical protein
MAMDLFLGSRGLRILVMLRIVNHPTFWNFEVLNFDPYSTRLDSYNQQKNCRDSPILLHCRSPFTEILIQQKPSTWESPPPWGVRRSLPFDREDQCTSCWGHVKALSFFAPLGGVPNVPKIEVSKNGWFMMVYNRISRICPTEKGMIWGVTPWWIVPLIQQPTTRGH